MTASLERLRAAIRRFAGTSSAGAGTAGLLRVTITDDAPGNRAGLDRLFHAFEATIDDLPAVLESAVPSIRDAHRAVFSSEGASGRGKWSALAPRTVAERTRLGYGGTGPILVRTGGLRNAVLTAPAIVRRFGDLVELRIQPPDYVDGVPKYVVNALGSSTTPARPMVAIGPSAARSVTSTIQRALRDRARAHGLR